MKLMKILKESETLHSLHSQQAKDLWFRINNYLLMSDDPAYDKIKKFRNAIFQLDDVTDKEQLVKYFNSEFGGVSSTPGEYYK